LATSSQHNGAADTDHGEVLVVRAAFTTGGARLTAGARATWRSVASIGTIARPELQRFESNARRFANEAAVGRWRSGASFEAKGLNQDIGGTVELERLAAALNDDTVPHRSLPGSWVVRSGDVEARNAEERERARVGSLGHVDVSLPRRRGFGDGRTQGAFRASARSWRSIIASFRNEHPSIHFTVDAVAVGVDVRKVWKVR
jgi:hypothetical protein